MIIDDFLIEQVSHRVSHVWPVLYLIIYDKAIGLAFDRAVGNTPIFKYGVISTICKHVL
jgi:hypothetical protein